MNDTITDDAMERAALLALAIDNVTPPPGPRPSIDEVIAWHHRELAEPRASEVKGHVARDPACYQIWVDVREAESLAVQTRPESSRQPTAERTPATTAWRRLADWLGDWLAPLFSPRGLGVGAVALLAAALGIRLLQTPDLTAQLGADLANMGWDTAVTVDQWPGRGGISSKGLGEDWADPDRAMAHAAFAAGVREYLARNVDTRAGWSAVIEALPREAPSCAVGDDACVEMRPLLRQAGRWTAAVFLHCQGQPGKTAEAAGVSTRPAHLAEALRDYVPAADIAAGYRQWQRATAASYCREAAAMLHNAIR